jgi:hypothetical protein
MAGCVCRKAISWGLSTGPSGMYNDITPMATFPHHAARQSHGACQLDQAACTTILLQWQHFHTKGMSSIGSKGNHMLKKDLLYEVAGLFLGDITVTRSRKLQKDNISSLSNKITPTKLTQPTLTTSFLFTIICHIDKLVCKIST